MVKSKRKTACTKNRFSRLFPCSFACLYLVFFVLNFETVSAVSRWQNAFGRWVEDFGKDLYDLAKLMTKNEEIKDQYRWYNAKVAQKSGLINITEENIGRMLRKKIDAVRCIADKAEQAAGSMNYEDFNVTSERETLQYYSSKYSPMSFEEGDGILRNCTTGECQFETISKLLYKTYMPFSLSRDTHFYDISVNTSMSSVHVPTNVYDHSNSSLKVLKWSVDLDKVFVDNYKADPALSWQYFGSHTGILRHYPAKSWEDRDIDSKIDVFDCRKRSWYIETATCSKDVIILLDNTGSMYHFLSFLAELTIKGILDTFSNNDFFNILTFTNKTYPLVECFNDSLIQATPENIRVFKNKVKGLAPSSYANDSTIREAFDRAFDILKNKRDNCTAMSCNQAIMYISDSIQGNLTDLFEARNRDLQGLVPVRVFTYLLGKEPTNVKEMEEIACQNRGDFQHIQTLDEVAEKVLEYVNTIATPLVLQGQKHPPTWTHAFKDVTYADEETSDTNKIYNGLLPPRLMFAVGVPAFQNISESTDENSTETFTPALLGVASTDVPVQDIDKLSLPYLLGVNGYSFIVSNNGYVLHHPDLRAMFYFSMNVTVPSGEKTFIIKNDTKTVKKYKRVKTETYILKDNYNSIDLTEIEQIDGVDDFSDTSSRPIVGGETLIKLRELALSNESGALMNVSVRFHYDKMRRAAAESYDYYFKPLKWTPFTLGLAIPSTYGRTYIKLNDEIRDNINKGINISEWFLGENWKINPDWVYCSYHYLEGHEFNTPEVEWLHFVRSFYNKTWKWSSQYSDVDEDEDSEERVPQCEGRKTLGQDGYYCNKELVEMLVFDAKITNKSYGTWHFNNTSDKHLAAAYNANLRFVATMSGLTRWQFICGEIEVEDDKEFGDYYTKAIDETWYKAAILQHKIDADSFVYSVPHDDPDDTAKEDGERKVTASYAIFRKDGKYEAPGCVVGFQFEQQKMSDRFFNITSRDYCNGCLETCGSDNIKCIVVDNNGYIVLSKDSEEVGTFFGEGYGAILEILLEKNVFQNTTIYDFQAMCKTEEDDSETSDAMSLPTPINVLVNVLKFGFMELMFYLSKFSVWVNAEYIFPELLQCDTPPVPPTPMSGDREAIPKDIIREQEIEERKKYHVCDKKAVLYIMQQEKKREETVETEMEDFYYQRIPYSNLLFIYLKKDTVEGHPVKYDASMEEIHYSEQFPCHKKNVNELSTRRLEDCFTCDEREKPNCSAAVSLKVDHRSVFYCLSSSILFLFTFGQVLAV